MGKRYTVEELTCPECGFVAKNANGLRGHRQFKHGVRPSGAQLPLQQQDLLISESKLEQLLDERFSVVSEQLDGITGVVSELQEGFPSVVAELNQRSSITDFPIPEQYHYLVYALRNLDAEAATMLLAHAGKADMLRPATDEDVKEVEDQQAEEAETSKSHDLAVVIAGLEAKASKPKEPTIVKGKRTGSGWKYLKNIDMSIKAGD